MPVKRDGIVEVTESFWYGCAACYSFEPSINSWAAQQGDDVRLTKMPITWGAIHQLHAARDGRRRAARCAPAARWPCRDAGGQGNGRPHGGKLSTPR